MIEAKYINTGTPEIARFDFSRVNKLGVDKTAARINKAAEYLWNIYGDKGTVEAPIVFSNLTRKAKLDFLASHLEQIINDAAKTQMWNEQEALARTAVQVSIEDN